MCGIFDIMAFLERVSVVPVRLNNNSWEYLLCAPVDVAGFKWEITKGMTQDREKTEEAAKRILMDTLALNPMILIETGLEYTDEVSEKKQEIYKNESIEKQVETIYEYVFIARVIPSVKPMINLMLHKKCQWFEIEEALDTLESDRERGILNYCKEFLEEE